MKNYCEKKRPLVQAITFEELVVIGIEKGAEMHDGMPAHFYLDDFTHVTQNDKDCYIVNNERFERGNILVNNKSGWTAWPCNVFHNKYELADYELDMIYGWIKEELKRATTKFPTWPNDPLHAAGIVSEEAGELVKEVNQLIYEPHKSTRGTVRDEAVQVATMAVRFLRSLDKYRYEPSTQHSQNDES